MSRRREKKKRGKKWRKFKLWSPSPEGKLACHLCRLSSHSHHPWKRERREPARERERGRVGWRKRRGGEWKQDGVDGEFKAGVEMIAEGKLGGAGLSQRNLQCSLANLSVDGDVAFHPPTAHDHPNRK